MNNSYTGVPKATSTDAIVTTQAARGKKRKRGQEQVHQIDTRPIHISRKDGGISTAHEIRPLKLITRVQLPLSFLHPTQLQHKRFHANIACLEVVETGDWVPTLLLAENEDRRLLAIEKVQNRVYAICSLADHVTIDDFSADHVSKQIFKRPNLQGDIGPWWTSAAVTFSESSSPSSRKAPKLDMLRVEDNQELERTRTASLPTIDTKSTEPRSHDPEVTAVADAVPAMDSMEACAAFNQHYLDMLYKSKASVAYLAKAHLPRLRNLLQTESDNDSTKLTEFLQSLVLASSTFDKKHKTLWLEKAKDILPQPLVQSPDSQEGHGKKERKKKPKIKPDKTGCLPDEDKHFTHWWLHDEDLPAPNETIDTRYRRRSLGLRTREAFLQLIIMLELSVLAQSRSDAFTVEDTLAETRPTKAKAKDNTVALELLVDKLCIWHSIDSTVVSASDDQNAQAKKVPDQLRSFCVEVIVPFYMSKAGDVAVSMNKKLGGPSAPSPTKRRKIDTVKSSSRTKRDPLQRVPSEKQPTKRHITPSLARAATDSQLIAGIKRESSEISLESIPMKLDLKAAPRRSSTLDKMKLRQREVDFDAMSQAQEIRRKKQAEVENKLKEAISALKKPNRTLAGKELADVAEQRELMAQAREKASKAQRARQRQQQIQVDATPKHNRIRPDLIATTPPSRHVMDSRQPHSSSTISRIVSSGIRPQTHEFDEDDVVETGHRPRHRAVDATPVHGMTKFAIPAIPESAIKQPLFGPTIPRNASIMETPVKPQNSGDGHQGNESGGLILGSTLATSIKSNRQHPEDPARVTVAETPKQNDKDAEDLDIYAALGWDD